MSATTKTKTGQRDEPTRPPLTPLLVQNPSSNPFKTSLKSSKSSKSSKLSSSTRTRPSSAVARLPSSQQSSSSSSSASKARPASASPSLPALQTPKRLRAIFKCLTFLLRHSLHTLPGVASDGSVTLARLLDTSDLKKHHARADDVWAAVRADPTCALQWTSTVPVPRLKARYGASTRPATVGVNGPLPSPSLTRVAASAIPVELVVDVSVSRVPLIHIKGLSSSRKPVLVLMTPELANARATSSIGHRPSPGSHARVHIASRAAAKAGFKFWSVNGAPSGLYITPGRGSARIPRKWISKFTDSASGRPRPLPSPPKTLEQASSTTMPALAPLPKEPAPGSLPVRALPRPPDSIKEVNRTDPQSSKPRLPAQKAIALIATVLHTGSPSLPYDAEGWVGVGALFSVLALKLQGHKPDDVLTFARSDPWKRLLLRCSDPDNPDKVTAVAAAYGWSRPLTIQTPPVIPPPVDRSGLPCVLVGYWTHDHWMRAQVRGSISGTTLGPFSGPVHISCREMVLVDDSLHGQWSKSKKWPWMEWDSVPSQVVAVMWDARSLHDEGMFMRTPGHPVWVINHSSLPTFGPSVLKIITIVDGVPRAPSALSIKDQSPSLPNQHPPRPSPGVSFTKKRIQLFDPITFDPLATHPLIDTCKSPEPLESQTTSQEPSSTPSSSKPSSSHPSSKLLDQVQNGFDASPPNSSVSSELQLQPTSTPPDPPSSLETASSPSPSMVSVTVPVPTTQHIIEQERVSSPSSTLHSSTIDDAAIADQRQASHVPEQPSVSLQPVSPTTSSSSRKPPGVRPGSFFMNATWDSIAHSSKPVLFIGIPGTKKSQWSVMINKELPASWEITPRSKLIDLDSIVDLGSSFLDPDGPNGSAHRDSLWNKALNLVVRLQTEAAILSAKTASTPSPPGWYIGWLPFPELYSMLAPYWNMVALEPPSRPECLSVRSKFLADGTRAYHPGLASTYSALLPECKDVLNDVKSKGLVLGPVSLCPALLSVILGVSFQDHLDLYAPMSPEQASALRPSSSASRPG